MVLQIIKSLIKLIVLKAAVNNYYSPFILVFTADARSVGNSQLSCWFFSEATAEAPTLIFTRNTSEDAVPRKDVLLGVLKPKPNG